MERVTGDDRAPGGVTGTGSVFAINPNGDNALATLRYKLKRRRHPGRRGAVRRAAASSSRAARSSSGASSQPTLDKAARGRSASRSSRSAAAPAVKMHPVRAARVAIMHTWTSTQTEGWWRQAFDAAADSVRLHQHAGRREDAEPQREVRRDHLSAGRRQRPADHRRACRCGATRCRGRTRPRRRTSARSAQTDDIRPGLGWQGLENLQSVRREAAACSSASTTPRSSRSTSGSRTA